MSSFRGAHSATLVNSISTSRRRDSGSIAPLSCLRMKYSGTIIVPWLNVRSAPSLRSPILAVDAYHLRVFFRGRQHDWYRVALLSGTIGWVVDSGVEPATSLAQGPVRGDFGSPGNPGPDSPRSTAQASGVSAANLGTQGTVEVGANVLRVHSASFLEAAVIGFLSRGHGRSSSSATFHPCTESPPTQALSEASRTGGVARCHGTVIRSA